MMVVRDSVLDSDLRSILDKVPVTVPKKHRHHHQVHINEQTKIPFQPRPVNHTLVLSVDRCLRCLKNPGGEKGYNNSD